MGSNVKWSAEAHARLENVPFFVRPWVRRRVEHAARERGLEEVTLALLDEVKSSEHRG